MGWFGGILNSATRAVKWIAPAALAPLTGGASLGAYAAYGQSSANKTNKDLAQRQMDFQERMSNTEWQRGVQDMLKAGINPMLATSQGGASAPAGATTRVENVAQPAINSALAARQAQANIQLTQASTLKTIEEAKTSAATAARAPEMAHYNVELIRKNIEKVIADFQLTHAQENQVNSLLPLLIQSQMSNIGLTQAQTTTASKEARLKELQIPGAEAEAKAWAELAGAGVPADAMAKILGIIRSILK